jgi:hypothetical protein
VEVEAEVDVGEVEVGEVDGVVCRTSRDGISAPGRRYVKR